MSRWLLALLFAFGTVSFVGLTGCEEETNTEEAVEDATDDATDAVEDAADDATDAVEDATN